MGETALHIACAGPALPCNVWASWGDLRNWSWCFKAGMKLSIQSVLEPWGCSSRSWGSRKQGGLCLAVNGQCVTSEEWWEHRHRKQINQASCETFGSVTTWTFDMWGCCSWPHWGECERHISGYFLGVCFFPFLINQTAFGNTCLTPQFFLLLECGCRVGY